jgi:hypothetical protein
MVVAVGSATIFGVAVAIVIVAIAAQFVHLKR